MIRAFLGLALPEAVRSALALQQALLPLPRRVAPETLHLTLVFLGEQPDAALEAAHDAFATLRVAAFPLSLQGLGLFGGARPRAAWAGVAPSGPLIGLQATAERAAHLAGIRLEHRRFVPHVTLGRFPPPDFAATARLERAVAEGFAFSAGPWMVQDMVLWRSHLGPRGARHDELARYPFAPGPRPGQVGAEMGPD
ncbi:RNA 2',3'-cyclic phosphodiesterase [Rhodobacter sp. Har01]|uniref:RNA 2',3'-cyclic phosphodiesterase n=1 Tax=Rhodobacter sp. Har01 TaxID=2883999 RepID=UPI001D06E6BE|nr:RNA 2',3'-cyclic phosphodiesterase [Rhodobacter sp. Har01]MCB6178835.1 RNA 2',3'-cyclic phosphodiesterase [Rhodobacter sp. Har01]